MNEREYTVRIVREASEGIPALKIGPSPRAEETVTVRAASDSKAVTAAMAKTTLKFAGQLARCFEGDRELFGNY